MANEEHTRVYATKNQIIMAILHAIQEVDWRCDHLCKAIHMFVARCSCPSIRVYGANVINYCIGTRYYTMF